MDRYFWIKPILCSQGVDFKLEIKNLALSDPKGHDLQKDIVVKVTSLASKQVGPFVFFIVYFELYQSVFSPCICFLSGVDMVQNQVCQPKIPDGGCLPAIPVGAE